MATQTELESMLIRLVGDGSSYQKMMTDAAKQSQVAADKVQVASKQIESISNQTKGFANAAVGALTSLGLAASLQGAFSTFTDYERTQIRIKNAIIASGQAVEPTLAQYKKLTDEIMATTTVSKGEVTGLIEKAQNMGKTGAALESLVKNSLAFAAATNGSAESGFHLAKALEAGNKPMLMHMLLGRGAKVSDQELSRIIQGRLAAGYRDLAEYNDTASGRMEKLGRTLKGLTVEFGGLVAKALQPVIDKVEKLVEWFGKLDPQIKQLSKVIAGIALLIVSIGPIVSFVGPLLALLVTPFVFLKGVLLALAPLVGGFWPALLLIGAAVAIVGVTVGVFIAKMGGLANAWQAVKDAGAAAWDWIKAKALQFWNWLWPVVQAARSFLIAVWDAIVSAATVAWNWIADKVTTAWTAIVNWLKDHNINFDQIRDGIRDAFIFAEFTVKNFRQVWDVVFAFMKWKAAEMFNTYEYGLTIVIPAALKWLHENWILVIAATIAVSTEMWLIGARNLVTIFKNIDWDGLWERYKLGVQRVVENTKNVFSNIRKIISGELTFDKLWGDGEKNNIEKQLEKVADALNGKKVELTPFVIPPRQLGELERQWKLEFEALKGKLGIDFAAFRAQKLAEFAANNQEQDAVKKDGIKLGQNFTGGLKQEVAKIQGILRFGAEAVSHISDYYDALKKINAGTGGGGGNPVNPLNPNNPPPLPNNPPPIVPQQANPNDNRRDGYLKVIAIAITELAKKQNINVPIPANL